MTELTRLNCRFDRDESLVEEMISCIFMDKDVFKSDQSADVHELLFAVLKHCLRVGQWSLGLRCYSIAGRYSFAGSSEVSGIVAALCHAVARQAHVGSLAANMMQILRLSSVNVDGDDCLDHISSLMPKPGRPHNLWALLLRQFSQYRSRLEQPLRPRSELPSKPERQHTVPTSLLIPEEMKDLVHAVRFAALQQALAVHPLIPGQLTWKEALELGNGVHPPTHAELNLLFRLQHGNVDEEVAKTISQALHIISSEPETVRYSETSSWGATRRMRSRCSRMLLAQDQLCARLQDLKHGGRWAESISLYQEIGALGLWLPHSAPSVVVESCLNAKQWEASLMFAEHIVSFQRLDRRLTKAVLEACRAGSQWEMSINVLRQWSISHGHAVLDQVQVVIRTALDCGVAHVAAKVAKQYRHKFRNPRFADVVMEALVASKEWNAAVEYFYSALVHGSLLQHRTLLLAQEASAAASEEMASVAHSVRSIASAFEDFCDATGEVFANAPDEVPNQYSN
jgi:hypothetical protein